MSNGKGLEGEGDAVIHIEHLRAVAPIEGDALAAAVQGHAASDLEGAAELDIPATGEGDDIAGVVSVGLRDLGLQLGV